ncbi:MAG: 50S ribosomal protein L31 [Anaerolineales bacterium]|nr:MAG: 50S ribosomal protein L31 [Anaerolineales bacterium]
MKEGIHPTYFPDANVVCACGNSWTTGSTVEMIHTDVCSKCHPFYTGEQRIVDTEGQVDRFYKRLQAREDYLLEQEARESARISPELPISELELGTRPETTLAKAGIETVGQVLELMTEGDKPLLAIDGFGRKSLAILKRSMRRRGFELPEDVPEQPAT